VARLVWPQVAIDFTGSNGSPSSPQSLHYMNPMGPNQYQLAIQAVGGVLEFYGGVRMLYVLSRGTQSRVVLS
jgi:hypothetical protein